MANMTWRRRPATLSRTRPTPRVELLGRDAVYVIRFELPGVRAEDIDVVVDDDVLTVSGVRRPEATEREGGASFTRSIELPRAVQSWDVEADFRDGVLEIRIPNGAAARARQVHVRGREP